ncbi:MAG TPA: YciI family protein [Nitrospirota bacterium]|nr:YciI family protein [Nitrospirota bacterium]
MERTRYFMSINKFRPDSDRAQINKTVPLHRDWAKQQLAAGVLVQAGKWGDHGGMIVIKATTREEADRVVNQDPLARAGLIEFETGELHPAVAFK